jgi:hypothetical protein
MANRWSTQFFGTLEKKPFQLSCNFVVDPTNQNGLGISSLKGPGIANVFMHTTASFAGDVASGSAVVTNISSTANLVVGTKISGTGIPAGTLIQSIDSATQITMSKNGSASNSGVTISIVANGSPNPASGLIIVNFQDNYNKYLFGTSQVLAPNTGGTINISTGSSLTLGACYVITAVGSTTTAQWQAVGVPVGIVPAVGVSFIAIATSGSGTGTVKAPGTSGLTKIEIAGSPNSTIISQAATVLGFSSGAYMILQALGPTLTMNSYTPAGTVAAGSIAVTSGTAGNAVTLNAGTTLEATGGGTIAVTSGAFTGTPAVLTGSLTYGLVAPTAASIINLSFFLSNSSITVQGQ